MTIKILTTIGSYDGWIVEFQFDNGKMATFSIDRGDYDNEKMFNETVRCIKIQLKAVGRDLGGVKINDH